MTVLVVSNPRTARARRRLADLRGIVSGPEDLQHHVTDDVSEATAVMAGRDWQPDDLLVINGGDGTAQHLLTVLLRRCTPQRAPAIAVLPGGTTNMTAFDINSHRRYADCLRQLQSALTKPDPEGMCRRPLVRVSLPSGDQYGFFFGIGTIVQGIEFFHKRIRPGGGRHELGAGLALLRTLWGIARHQPPFAEPLSLQMASRNLAQAAAMTQGMVANHWEEVAIRLCLVTALDRLFLGMRPYWSCAGQPLHATLVEADAQRFIRSMPRLLTGRPGPAMTPACGFHSTGLRSLRLRFHGPMTLDGELFSNDGDIIGIDATEPLRFLPL